MGARWLPFAAFSQRGYGEYSGGGGTVVVQASSAETRLHKPQLEVLLCVKEEKDRVVHGSSEESSSVA